MPAATPKEHFGGVEFHAILLEYLEGLAQVIKVLLCEERLDEHVVYVDLHAQVVCEHFVDKPLVGCTSVLQAEGHDLIAEDPPFGGEGRLLLVILVHQDLIIA